MKWSSSTFAVSLFRDDEWCLSEATGEVSDCGCFGVRRVTEGGYQVVHLPTTKPIRSFRSRTTAKRFAYELSRRADWTFTGAPSPESVKAFRDVRILDAYQI